LGEARPAARRVPLDKSRPRRGAIHQPRAGEVIRPVLMAAAITVALADTAHRLTTDRTAAAAIRRRRRIAQARLEVTMAAPDRMPVPAVTMGAPAAEVLTEVMDAEPDPIFAKRRL
jgi:hypothetical protein